MHTYGTMVIAAIASIFAILYVISRFIKVPFFSRYFHRKLAHVQVNGNVITLSEGGKNELKLCMELANRLKGECPKASFGVMIIDERISVLLNDKDDKERDNILACLEKISSPMMKWREIEKGQLTRRLDDR